MYFADTCVIWGFHWLVYSPFNLVSNDGIVLFKHSWVLPKSMKEAMKPLMAQPIVIRQHRMWVLPKQRDFISAIPKLNAFFKFCECQSGSLIPRDSKSKKDYSVSLRLLVSQGRLPICKV